MKIERGIANKPIKDIDIAFIKDLCVLLKKYDIQMTSSHTDYNHDNIEESYISFDGDGEVSILFSELLSPDVVVDAKDLEEFLAKGVTE